MNKLGCIIAGAVFGVVITQAANSAYHALTLAVNPAPNANCPKTAQEVSNIIGVPAERLIRNNSYSVPAWSFPSITPEDPPYLVDMKFGFDYSRGGTDSWMGRFFHPAVEGTWFCVYPNDPKRYAPGGLSQQMGYVLFSAHQRVVGGEIHLNNGITVKDCYLADAPSGGYAQRTFTAMQGSDNFNPPPLVREAIVNPRPDQIRVQPCPDLGSPLAVPSSTSN